MNELYIEKLLRLIERGVITAIDIKDLEYRTEIEKRLGQ